MLVDANIAQLTKRQAVDRSSRFSDLPDAISYLFLPQRLFPVWGASVSDLAFGCQRNSHAPVSHTLVSCHTCRRNATTGRKTAEAERAHGWLAGAGDRIHLFWRSDLHQYCRAAGEAWSG